MATFYRPETLREALELMGTYAGTIRPLAGGTDLMVHLREQSRKVQGITRFMDIARLPQLHGMCVEEGELCIGAGVSHTEIAASPLVRQYVGALCDASGSVGSPQIRNSGTIGGNVCNGSLAADTLSVLTAVDARLELHSTAGVRLVKMAGLHQGRGKLDIQPNELLVRLRLPILEGYRFAFLKLGRRKALAISRMNMAVAVKLQDGVMVDVRIAPGCVFSQPERAGAAEALLRGRKPDAQLLEQAGKAVSAQMIERTGIRWSTEYKQPVVEALTVRALQTALEG